MTEFTHQSDPPTRLGRLQTVTVQRPRCPHCGNARLRKYRSLTNQGDGTALAWVKCAQCGQRFKLLQE